MKIHKVRRVRYGILISIYAFTIANSFPLWDSEFQRMLALTQLIFGGWFGLLLIALSIKFVKNLDIMYAFRYGIAGCSLLIFNIIFIMSFYPWYSHYSFILYYDIFSIILFCVFFGLLLRYQNTLKESSDEARIRKTILEFGTEITRLKVDEIAEKTETFHKTIIEVVNNMIKNQEIYARYFKSSNSVVFNQEKNIEDIDDLMTMFREWEEVKTNKI